MTSTDDRLRRLFREARHDPLLREQAKAEMARAGLDRDAIRAMVLAGLRKAFVELMDYGHIEYRGVSFVVDKSPHPEGSWGDCYVAHSRSESVGIRIFYPTDDEIIDLGGRLDLRFVISASLRERALAIECVEECFPGAVVVSSAVANGQRPPRLEDLRPINDEELEETPKHRRGKWL